MDLRKCVCGKIYDAERGKLCPFCKERMEEMMPKRTAYVKIMYKDGMAERYDLIPGTEYAVGRNKAVCQIAVRDQFTDVSRVHCAIKTFEDMSGIGKIVKIRDLSNNGIAALNRNAKPSIRKINKESMVELRSEADKYYFLLGGKNVAIEIGMNK